MVVNGQIDAPAALSPGKQPSISTQYESGCGEDKISYPCRESIPRRPELDAKPTELVNNDLERMWIETSEH
jgi:hypothetical protein